MGFGSTGSVKCLMAEALIKAMEDPSKRGCTYKELYQVCNRKWRFTNGETGQEREYDHTLDYKNIGQGVNSPAGTQGR